MSAPRYVRDGIDGPVYRVALAPRELPDGGVDPDMRTLVFEEILTRTALTVPIDQMWHLDQLTDADLEELLRDARR